MPEELIKESIVHKQIKGKRNYFWMALLLAGVLGLAGVSDIAKADGLQAGSFRLTTMRASPGGIGWTPLVANNGVVLTVSGGDFNFRQVFRGGENPAFKPYDLEGNRLPDGVYKWQITFRPDRVTAVDDGISGRDPKLVEKLTRRSASRSRSNLRSTRQLRMSDSGAFSIINGAILDPSIPEPGVARPTITNNGLTNGGQSPEVNE